MLHIARLGANAEIAIYAKGYGKRIGNGTVVDLAEPVTPTTSLADHLGDLVHCFEPLDPPLTFDVPTDTE